LPLPSSQSALAPLPDGSYPTAPHSFHREFRLRPCRPSQRRDISQPPLPPAAQAPRAQIPAKPPPFHAYKEPCAAPHPASHRHSQLPSFMGLLAPPPTTTTACNRPPPRSRLHSPSPTKVRGKSFAHEPLFVLPHVPVIAMARLAGIQSRPLSLLYSESRGRGRRWLFC
jgi:hypothetical protein